MNVLSKNKFNIDKNDVIECCINKFIDIFVIFESRLILISYTIIKWECNGNGILAMFYLIFYPLHMNIIFNLIKLSERSNFLIIEIIFISTWEYQ